jgi:hypothetical protein
MIEGLGSSIEGLGFGLNLAADDNLCSSLSLELLLCVATWTKDKANEGVARVLLDGHKDLPSRV